MMSRSNYLMVVSPVAVSLIPRRGRGAPSPFRVPGNEPTVGNIGPAWYNCYHHSNCCNWTYHSIGCLIFVQSLNVTLFLHRDVIKRVAQLTDVTCFFVFSDNIGVSPQ